ncbi:MAG: hypothetical protein IPM63_16035 [Acidobacteriota bacterium]|nr:MAG: hypothetical protein IPM63_16035 [Acidobacteriota bacterium]
MNGPHLLFREFLDKHEEWIAVHRDGSVFGLRSHEMELEERFGPTTFGFLDNKGYSVWRLEEVSVEDRSAKLLLSRRFGSVLDSLELIPRASAEELGAGVREARLAAANAISEAVADAFPKMKLRRVSMNRPHSRHARIILDGGALGDNGVIADVSGGSSPERLLTAAVLWQSKAGSSSKRRLRKVFVVARKGKLSALKRLHACLSDPVRKRIGILSLKNPTGPPSIGIADPIEFDDLWKPRASPLRASGDGGLPDLARSVVETDPLNIDNLFARHGATLRYLGLPFARFRELGGDEKAWFGIEREKQILDEDSSGELTELLESLAEYRRFDSPNKQHLFYQAAPEAWLESLLRRDVRVLDRNLVLSPIYNQFRTSRDRIDLLALTEKGRLAIVELKVSHDPTMVFQAVDYWRRIELQRRQGMLDAAGLFGKRKIADRPAMIYLAAPATCFGAETEKLVEAVSGSIRIVRFELNEDWRREVKVVRVV